MSTREIVLLLLVVAAAGCGASQSAPAAEPEPTASTEPAASRELTEDEMLQLRAALPLLHAGMTQSEVLAALPAGLARLGQLGTGPLHEVTTIFVLGHASQLNLTWDMTDEAHIVLVRAELLEPHE